MVGGHKQGRKPDSFRFHSTTEVYDHATESWSTMPALLQLPRASCLAAVLGHADAPGTQKRMLLVALLGFGWAVSASLAVHWPAGSLSLSLSFYTAQEVLHLALPFLPDSAAGLWHDIVAGSQTMVVTGGWSGPFRHKVTEVLDSSCGTWRQPPQAEIGARLPLVVCWLGVVVGAEGVLCVCRWEATWGRYARAQMREEGERRDGQ